MFHQESLLQSFSDESLEALYLFAYSSYDKGKYEESTSLFRILTLQKKECRHYWMGYGASLQMLKRYEEAIGAYGYAAILDSKDPFVHLHAAECYHALKDHSKSMLALDSALTCNPPKKLKDQLSLLKEVWAQGGHHVSKN